MYVPGAVVSTDSSLPPARTTSAWSGTVKKKAKTSYNHVQGSVTQNAVSFNDLNSMTWYDPVTAQHWKTIIADPVDRIMSIQNGNDSELSIETQFDANR